MECETTGGNRVYTDNNVGLHGLLLGWGRWDFLLVAAGLITRSALYPALCAQLRILRSSLDAALA